LAGAGLKGAVGMAAVRLLAEQNVVVRLVLSTSSTSLSPVTAVQYQILQECGILAWGLSMSQAEIDAQEPIEWLSVALFVDAMLDADLTKDPDGEAADLIRMVNTTRRPILSYEVPSGVSTDEGYILSPCIMATQTLVIGVPLRGVIEAAPVAGEMWLASGGIPDSVWNSIGVAPYPVEGESPINLGATRRLR
jgi:NAD(P)H-hydrate repair Nnr-like enzyme with NAD(P)H-hydrate epimerase domain